MFLARAAAVAVIALLAGCAPANPELTSPQPPANDPPASTPATAEPSTATQAEPETDQAALNQKLRDAAWKGDVDTAAALIKQGADINAKDHTIQSAYLIAASEGHLDFLRLALDNGAEVSDLDSWDGTALIRAAERGHADVVGQLVQAKINLDHVNTIGYQAIHEAIWLGSGDQRYVDTVRVLAASGATLDRESANERLTPLQMAMDRGFTEIEQTLNTALADSPTDDASEDLLLAAATGDADEVARLLRLGADIESRDSKERTPLLLAVTGDHVSTARLLVSLGADVNAVDGQEDTPWLVTGVTGSVAMVDALLPGDPDQTLVNRFGGISIIPASERGHADYVARVVKLDGVDVNHVNELGWTALLEAVILGDGSEPYQKIVTTLVAAGADTSIGDKDGVTALEHAQDRGQKQIVLLLNDK